MSQRTFKSFDDQQLNMNDPIYSLSPRMLQRLEKGWPGQFHKIILPILIDSESDFAPLYSDVRNSRPSTLLTWFLDIWF